MDGSTGSGGSSHTSSPRESRSSTPKVSSLPHNDVINKLNIFSSHFQIEASSTSTLEENIFKVGICYKLCVGEVKICMGQVEIIVTLFFMQLLKKFDKGTFAKRLGKVYQSEFKTTPPENILDLARTYPFVKFEMYVTLLLLYLLTSLVVIDGWLGLLLVMR